MPAGANGVSFGLALIANGTLTTDNYSFVLPLAGAAAPSASPAGVLTRPGGGTPISQQKLRVHSHLKLLIPGNGKLRTGQSFPLPEWPRTARQVADLNTRTDGAAGHAAQA